MQVEANLNNWKLQQFHSCWYFESKRWTLHRLSRILRQKIEIEWCQGWWRYFWSLLRYICSSKYSSSNRRWLSWHHGSRWTRLLDTFCNRWAGNGSGWTAAYVLRNSDCLNEQLVRQFLVISDSFLGEVNAKFSPGSLCYWFILPKEPYESIEIKFDKWNVDLNWVTVYEELISVLQLISHTRMLSGPPRKWYCHRVPAR